MNELMREEILDQPAALEQTLGSIRGQLDRAGLDRQFAHVVFTGSGDSYFAPLALHYAARRHARAMVSVLPAMEAAYYFSFSPDMLVVPISVSGEAKRTVAAARAARAAGAFVLPVTANAGSTLSQVATHSLLLQFRSRSRKTPHTTDFLTTLLAVSALLESLGGTPVVLLERLPALIGELVATLEEPCRELGRELAAAERFYFLGAGPSFAIAQYAAEKFWEAGGLEAHAFELEEFAHGAHLLVEAGDPAFLVAPAGESSTRAAEIGDGLHEVGARVHVLTDGSDAFPAFASLPLVALPEEWSPFVTAIPVQWLCWAVATAKGYDVVRKDGRHANVVRYERVHERWVRG